MVGLLCMQAGNVTKERMAGYDRSIRSEPNFEPSQQEGLITDLTAYLQTLQVGCETSMHPLSDLNTTTLVPSNGIMVSRLMSRYGYTAMLPEPVPWRIV